MSGEEARGCLLDARRAGHTGRELRSAAVGFLQGGPTCLLWGRGLASSPRGVPRSVLGAPHRCLNLSCLGPVSSLAPLSQ